MQKRFVAASLKLAVAAALLFSPFAAKQASAVDLGVQAGLNFGSLSVSGGAGGATGTTNLMLGVFIEEYLAKQLLVQPELNYMGQGTGLDYLAIPVMLKYKFIDKDSFRPFVAIGPEFDIKLSGAVKSLSVGLDFAGGFHYIMGPTYSLFLQGRYSLGLTNISQLAGASVKLRNFHLLGGVLFAI